MTIHLQEGTVVRCVSSIGATAKPGMLGVVAQKAEETGWYRIRWLTGKQCVAYPEEIEAIK